MKLAIVCSTGDPFSPQRSGALATSTWECCNAAARQGMQWTVVGLRAEGARPYPWEHSILWSPPRRIRDAPSRRSWRLVRRVSGWETPTELGLAIRALRYLRSTEGAGHDAVVVQNAPRLAMLLRRWLPRTTKVAHWFRNPLLATDAVRRRYRRSGIITLANSRFTARSVELSWGLESGSARVVYPGVNLEEFHQAPVPREGPVVVSFLGRTGVEKGLDLLLEALIMLRRAMSHEPIAVLVIGSNVWGGFSDDPYQRRLDEQVRCLGQLGVAVERTGHVDRGPRVGELLRGAHVHVIPSRWDEPFGLTTLEGMASGCAVVATATGGTPEVVGDAGVLVPREDPTAMAQAIAGLLDDQALRERLGARARQRAGQFTWDRTVGDLVHALQD